MATGSYLTPNHSRSQNLDLQTIVAGKCPSNPENEQEKQGQNINYNQTQSTQAIKNRPYFFLSYSNATLISHIKIMVDPSSFANPTPLAHADASRDVFPRGGTSHM
ncbi:hypothetical protein TNCV_690721 [Trichonephila clavipes]|nr:hypothetical protein TNCV_690721 [Trichonephila clavipes]